MAVRRQEYDQFNHKEVVPFMPDSGELGGRVGDNILRLRRQAGMTQQQLADPEYSISYISAIERGRIRPSLKALEYLAQRLNVTSSELLSDHPVELSSTGTSDPEDPKANLLRMLRQRPSGQLPQHALRWASISLARSDPQFACELLTLLSPGSITAEQRLLRLAYLGGALLAQGHLAEAQTTLEPLFRQDEFSGHTELLARARFALARVYQAQEKFLLAEEAFHACVQAIDKDVVRDPLYTIEVYSGLAELYRHWDRRETAIRYYQQALNQFEYLLNPALLAENSVRMSLHHMENIRSTLADWYATRSRALFEFALVRQHFAEAAANLGLTLKELDKLQSAEQQMRQAINISEQLGTARQAILTRVELADLLLEHGEPQEAERLALEAQQRCHPNQQDEIKDEPLYGRVLVTLADAHKAANRLADAERSFQQAIDLLKKHHATDHLSQAYFRYSGLLHQLGRDAESFEMVTQAYLLSHHKPETGDK
jgi:tetratricopeptide (TPR) repeat protein